MCVCPQVGASVRCITWLDNSCLLIGCLDGLSHKWIIGEGIEVKIMLIPSKITSFTHIYPYINLFQ